MPSNSPSPNTTTSASLGINSRTACISSMCMVSGKCPFLPWRVTHIKGKLRFLYTTLTIKVTHPRPVVLPSIAKISVWVARFCKRTWINGKKYTLNSIRLLETHRFNCLILLSSLPTLGISPATSDSVTRWLFNIPHTKPANVFKCRATFPLGSHG